jgi:hypothetical protein
MSVEDLDQALAALGLLTSRFNFLESEFKFALFKLLNCRNRDAAYAVINERRRFEDLVALVKELFEICNADTDSRKQLSGIIATAKGLSDRRNAYIHSMWYVPIQGQRSPVTRMKGRSTEELTPSQMIQIAEEMADCRKTLRNLMTQSLPIDGRQE